jgi:hypothetical protein
VYLDSSNVTKLIADKDAGQIVERVVGDIVKGPATKQALKGIVSAGIGKAFRYALEKMRKGRQK